MDESGKGRGGVSSAEGRDNRQFAFVCRKMHARVCDVGSSNAEVVEVRFADGRQLMGMKISGAAGHKQLVRLIKSFSSGLEEARENLELEILSVLRRLGADGSLEYVVTAASDGTALESCSPRAVERSRSLE